MMATLLDQELTDIMNYDAWINESMTIIEMEYDPDDGVGFPRIPSEWGLSATWPTHFLDSTYTGNVFGYNTRVEAADTKTGTISLAFGATRTGTPSDVDVTFGGQILTEGYVENISASVQAPHPGYGKFWEISGSGGESTAINGWFFGEDQALAGGRVSSRIFSGYFEAGE